jgi:hypothetical protein
MLVFLFQYNGFVMSVRSLKSSVICYFVTLFVTFIIDTRSILVVYSFICSLFSDAFSVTQTIYRRMKWL